MEEQKFVANPHALIVNNVCTEVVYMQDYDSEEIAKTLEKYTYDEVVRWEDYGHPIYVGYHKVDDVFTTHKAYPSWIWSMEAQNWIPPVDYPEDTESLYFWREDTMSWDKCAICKQVEK